MIIFTRIFFPKPVRGGILPLCDIEEKRGKEGEEFLSYSKWKEVIWPCFTCKSSNVHSPPLGWWKSVWAWATKEFRACVVPMASLRIAWQADGNPFHLVQVWPLTCVLKTPHITSLFLRMLLSSALHCCVPSRTSHCLFSSFRALSWQTASSFESRYFMCTCPKESIFLINPFPLSLYIAWHVFFVWVVFLSGGGGGCLVLVFFFLVWQLNLNYWDQ